MTVEGFLPPAPKLRVEPLLRFQRYADAFGSRVFSLDELLAGPPGLPTAGFATGDDTVPIESICFTGPAALTRALSLRDQVRSALARGEIGRAHV